MAVAGPVGLRIRDQRKRQGLTQAGLAERVGISPSYMNLIEADRRSVGGSLLQKIAAALETELDILAGTEERRLIERLGEVAASPVLQSAAVEPDSANVLVSRHPDWARAMLQLWRTYQDSEAYAGALSEKLGQDPVVSAAIFDLLNNATTIRATSEVLDTVDDLTTDQHDRFVDIILSRSGELANQADQLVKMFSETAGQRRSHTPAEEVDDFYIHNRAWFPDLDAAAAELRRTFSDRGPMSSASLLERLERDFQINRAPESPKSRKESTAVRMDYDRRRIEISIDAPETTVRFQLATCLVRHVMEGELDAVLDTDLLTTDASRARARNALRSWSAGACLMPYDHFLEDAERLRYDIEALAERHKASFEQVSVRLVSLRKNGSEGVPLGLLKTDPCGLITKRFPIPGLPFPRSGVGCPIWPLYSAFQTPGRINRQFVELPNGSRFLFVARTLADRTANFEAAPFLRSIMLTCDAAYADRMVYSDRLDTGATGDATHVGLACRVCPRTDCHHRGEESILATGFGQH